MKKTLRQYAEALNSGDGEAVRAYVTDECYAAADYQADIGIFSGLKYVKAEQVQLYDNTVKAQVLFSTQAELAVQMELELKKVGGVWLVSDDSALRAMLKGDAQNIGEGATGEPGIKWDFETEGANLFDNSGAFAISVCGVEKKLPFALSELSGVIIAEEYLNFDVEAGYYYEAPFSIDGKDAGLVIIYNNTDGKLKLRDCLVGGVSFDAKTASQQIMLPENIGIGSTVEEVQNAFGPPTGMDFSESGEECTYVYTKAENQEVRLTFADGQTVSGCLIKCFVM